MILLFLSRMVLAGQLVILDNEKSDTQDMKEQIASDASVYSFAGDTCLESRKTAINSWI